MRQEMRGFWDAVASAEPYANNLHLASHRQPHQHFITEFLQAGCTSRRPINGVEALKANHTELKYNQNQKHQQLTVVKSTN